MYNAKRIILFIVHTARYVVYIFHTWILKKGYFFYDFVKCKKGNCTCKDAFKQANKEISYEAFEYHYMYS